MYTSAPRRTCPAPMLTLSVWPEQERPLSLVWRVKSPVPWVSLTVQLATPVGALVANCWLEFVSGETLSGSGVSAGSRVV